MRVGITASTPLGATFDYAGSHYSVADSPGLPKPVQDPVPIIIGGGGPRRTPALAAGFAREFNAPFNSVDVFGERVARVRAACEAIDRDPDSLTYSATLVAVCGEDERELERRAAAIGREAAELRENGIAGTPAEVREKVDRWREAGADRLHLQILDMSDLDHLDLLARTLAG